MKHVVQSVITGAAVAVALSAAAQNHGVVSIQAGGEINGESIDPADPAISVEPDEILTGSIPVNCYNPYDGNVVFPVGATATWGNRESQPWVVDGSISPGWTTLTVPVNIVAPTDPGTYHLLVASGPRYDIAQVLSATTAAMDAVWYDGNDLGWDFEQWQLDEAASQGFTTTYTLTTNGDFVAGLQGVTVVEVLVGQCAPEEVAKLVASDADVGAFLGESVDISGDVIAVGASYDSDSTGAVYVFRPDGSGGWLESKITASDGAPGARLGNAVAISGETLAAAAYGDGSQGGALYVFRDDGNGIWTELAKLEPSDGPTPGFGHSIDTDGETIVVGAIADGSGSAYVFRDDGNGNWSQIQKLVPSDGAAGDHFGGSVAFDGEFLVVGMGEDDDNGSASGSAVVFRDDGSGDWIETQKLTASDGSSGAIFGNSVAIDGDLMIVGAGRDAVDGPVWSGAAYIFRHDGTGQWNEVSKLVAPNPESYDEFGAQVAISGQTAIAASWREDVFGTDSGAVYVFRETSPGEWQFATKITPTDADQVAQFGYNLGIFGDRLAVGAPLVESGSAYLFDLNCVPTPAELIDVVVAFGSHLSGGLPDLGFSDDLNLRTRSRVGFSALEPNLTELVIVADSDVPGPSMLHLRLEERFNQPLDGTSKVRLANWTTGSFESIQAFTLTNQDALHEINEIDATNFVRSSDGRIEMSIKHVVIATFSAIGFDSYFDLVEIGVE